MSDSETWNSESENHKATFKRIIFIWKPYYITQVWINKLLIQKDCEYSNKKKLNKIKSKIKVATFKSETSNISDSETLKHYG